LKIAKKNPLERLVHLNPETEIWWDSSPLIYADWSESFLKQVPAEKASVIKTELEKMYDSKNPENSLFRGVTTNPPLSLAVIKMREQYVASISNSIIDNNPSISKEDLFWQTYKEIVKRGAEMYLEIFEKSNHKYGHLSGQVDPRSLYDVDAMMKQALELASLSPNVMIKVPGSKEGYEVIKQLTAKGIATNNTLTFTLPQLIMCAEKVKEGLEIAKKNKVDLSRWRSVITYMAARYGELRGTMKKEAESLGIELSESDTRWAEMAIFKKAYMTVKERGYPSKMLLCSMRISPTVKGKKRCWHLEKVAGGDIILTCPPSFIEGVFETLENTKFTNQIEKKVPKKVLERLLRIPYFEKAYMEDGYVIDEFNTHPALKATEEEFSKATDTMVGMVAKQLDNRRKK